MLNNWEANGYIVIFLSLCDFTYTNTKWIKNTLVVLNCLILWQSTNYGIDTLMFILKLLFQLKRTATNY